MNIENQWIAVPPFDLYQLELVGLVAEHRSFTAAARAAGLTQSAMTRQVRGLEERLGVALFERTTREVRVTAAGEALVDGGGDLLEAAAGLSREMNERFGDAPPTVSVGIARSMGVGYLPGFFDRFHRRCRKVNTEVHQEIGRELLLRVAGGDLDVGIVSARSKLPSGLEVCDSFPDRFVAVVPEENDVGLSDGERAPTAKQLAKALRGERWIALGEASESASLVRGWMAEVGLAEVRPAMELDSFDLIVNLVSQGLGVAVVPRRVLPLYARRRVVRAISFRPALRREVWVVARKDRRRADHLQCFIDSVLF
jgi:DNA-binding transcriptional LysR family regulator